MRVLLCGLATAALLLTTSARVDGQTIVLPEPVIAATIQYPGDSPLTRLRALVAAGNLREAARVGATVVQTLARVPPFSSLEPRLDPTRNWYRLVFTSRDADGDANLASVLVHGDGRDETVTATLPGLHGASMPLVEVLLAEDASVALQSVYSSQWQDAPIAAQAGAFVNRILPTSLLSAWGTTGSEALGFVVAPPAAPASSPLRVSVTRVVLPHKRAALSVHSTIAVTDPMALWRAQASALREESHTGQSALAGRLADAVTDVTRSPACPPAGLSMKECLDAARRAIKDTYAHVSSDAAAYRTAVAFQQIVATEPKPISATTQLVNRPCTRFGFALGTSYIAHVRLFDPRVKLQSGLIVIDPPRRVLAMGVLNFHPLAYDPDLPGMGWAARVRTFGGIAFAPHFGPVAGLGLGVTRNFALTGGAAWLLIDSVRPGDTLGAAPRDPLKPFRVGSALAWFAGASFAVK
jgi:hypothetical protein